jgi:hypothetical protein
MDDTMTMKVLSQTQYEISKPNLSNLGILRLMLEWMTGHDFHVITQQNAHSHSIDFICTAKQDYIRTNHSSSASDPLFQNSPFMIPSTKAGPTNLKPSAHGLIRHGADIPQSTTTKSPGLEL